jgi:hypothetical protein
MKTDKKKEVVFLQPLSFYKAASQPSMQIL